MLRTTLGDQHGVRTQKPPPYKPLPSDAAASLHDISGLSSLSLVCFPKKKERKSKHAVDGIITNQKSLTQMQLHPSLLSSHAGAHHNGTKTCFLKNFHFENPLPCSPFLPFFCCCFFFFPPRSSFLTFSSFPRPFPPFTAFFSSAA